MARLPLSVTIIARDAADEIGPCLDSVAFADEILVVDSGSRDDTVGLAQAKGARVIQQAWLGYGRQKQFAVEAAAHDWVLSLDADERVSPELRQAIEAALVAPAAAGFEMARRNRFLGRWLAHGEGYPDWSLRLFDRRRARWSEDPVHEKVICSGPVERLHGDLLHESCDTLERYLAKQNHYTSLQAEALHRRGEQAGLFRLLLSPLFRFVRFYFLRGGFLDGLPGFIHIVIGCMNSFLKYAKLFERQGKDRH
jgi:glycosyltransferase involved in cell wall biosynthesis